MSRPGTFEILAVDPITHARRGRLSTAHGTIETPVFMPVGTQASVKAMSPEELKAIHCEILLSNTYHLNDRPGIDLIKEMGGLHRFMGWDRAILTDSGGYQVFSMSRMNKIINEGVEFQSHVDGQRLFLGPTEAMKIQRRLGSDIAMVFDECPPYPCKSEYACQAVDRTLAWAARCAQQPRAEGQLVFGIVQGGLFDELRLRCARELVEIGFDGYAIGGVSVGESDHLIQRGLEITAHYLPVERPRYAMGVGVLSQMIEGVANGVDMFDCVLPTRLARNGTAFTAKGRYPVKAGRFRMDSRPIEEGCSCYACRHFSRAYVRHLLNVGEILGLRLVTMHNLYRYAEIMNEVREAITAGDFANYRAAFVATYRKVLPE